MEEISIKTISWSAPEYNHNKKSPDFFWAIGLIAIVGFVIALFMANYIFSIFILISGACLIMFTIREPKNVSFEIKTEGFLIGKDNHEWKTIKGFNIKNGEPYAKLMIQTSKYFLPIYTIPLPSSILEETKETLLKVIPNIELKESSSMAFAERLGF